MKKEAKGGSLSKYESLMEQGIPKRLALSMACNQPGDHNMSGIKGFSKGGGDKQVASEETCTLRERLKAEKGYSGGILTRSSKKY